jgi:serine phosphatase RsbU (regulator of sigma subunit)
MTETIGDPVRVEPPRPSSLTVVSNVEHLSMAGRCVPSGLRGEPIAGDFFDVFGLDESRLLIAVGDVAGHGVAVGARMIQLRADMRELALVTTSLAEVLWRLDLIHAEHALDEIATLWLGIYDVRTGGLQHSSAGHLPLILAEVDGRARLLPETSAPPLGTGFVEQHARVEEIQLPIGALLVAYSDGLVERPDRDLDCQIELLRRVVEGSYEPDRQDVTLDELVQSILAKLVPDLESARDDICLLLLRRDAVDELRD